MDSKTIGFVLVVIVSAAAITLNEIGVDANVPKQEATQNQAVNTNVSGRVGDNDNLDDAGTASRLNAEGHSTRCTGEFPHTKGYW